MKQSKPYGLWLKQCGKWSMLGESDNPADDSLSPSHVDTTGLGVQRLELRDLDGTLVTYFDSSWKQLIDEFNK